jgi:DNA-binding MarR family transcriptional regulator
MANNGADNAPLLVPRIAPQAIVEVCLCHHARRAARAITRVFDEALAPLQLTGSQFNILVAVGARRSGSATDIARLLAMDRTTLSRNLKPLRAAGYLTTEGGAGRRPSTVALTEAGQDLLAQASPLWQEAQGQLTARLGAGQSGLLLQALEAMTTAANDL